MKYFLITIIIAFAITNYTYSQVTEQWVQRYDGPGHRSDDANSIAIDGSENLYVTGSSIASGTNPDFVTIKYNSSGVMQWTQRYDVSGAYDEAISIAVDDSGYVYVTGTSGTNFGTYDLVTIKYNTLGDQQWVQRYNGPGNYDDGAVSVKVDFSGNVYVTANILNNGDYTGYETIKYNSSGVQQWVQRYFGAGALVNSLAVDNSGVYITGSPGSNSGYLTIKYNSNGDILWSENYNLTGGSIDAATSLALDVSGNIYVTGYSSDTATSTDIATIKYNSSGVRQWVQRYDGPAHGTDGANSIKADISGNVYVTGQSTGIGTNTDLVTIKYNSSGVQQWIQIYDGPAHSYGESRSVEVDGSGNVYITGRSFGIGTSFDFATIKYNSSGVQQWIQIYNGPGNSFDYARSLLLSSSGNVYVTGSSTGSGTGMDYATIKYSQLTGIAQNLNTVPGNFSLSQNYPNPFNPTTKINFSVPVNSLVTLKIYDVLGKEVMTLINEQKPAGNYAAEFNGANLSSGIYFYKIQSDQFSETKRMSLIK